MRLYIKILYLILTLMLLFSCSTQRSTSVPFSTEIVDGTLMITNKNIRKIDKKLLASDSLRTVIIEQCGLRRIKFPKGNKIAWEAVVGLVEAAVVVVAAVLLPERTAVPLVCDELLGRVGVPEAVELWVAVAVVDVPDGRAVVEEPLWVAVVEVPLVRVVVVVEVPLGRVEVVVAELPVRVAVDVVELPERVAEPDVWVLLPVRTGVDVVRTVVRPLLVTLELVTVVSLRSTPTRPAWEEPVVVVLAPDDEARTVVCADAVVEKAASRSAMPAAAKIRWMIFISVQINIQPQKYVFFSINSLYL